MEVAFYLAREMTQVLDAIPWVHCASGNVFNSLMLVLMTLEMLTCVLLMLMQLLKLIAA